jgi:hypothetical protein
MFFARRRLGEWKPAVVAGEKNDLERRQDAVPYYSR